MLAYERMDVYQWAVEFLALVARVLEKMPRGNSGLSDQLRRASLSIPLNIAEGSGKLPTSVDHVYDHDDHHERERVYEA